MATLDPLTLIADIPVNLVTERALAAGDYIISNGGQTTVSLFEGGAEAPAHRKGHPVAPGGTWSFTVAADPIWAWSAGDADVVISGA